MTTKSASAAGPAFGDLAGRLAALVGAAGVKHVIDGVEVEGREGRTFPTSNPATNQVICQVAEGTAADVDVAVDAARRAFDGGAWSGLAPAERARTLRRLADLIDRDADTLAVLETLDTGQTIRQTRNTQIPRAAENFRFFAEMAGRAADGHTYPAPGFLNYTIRQPVGVAGLITPWNTPFMLETWRVAPALAAGCTAVLKPAEWAPITATRLALLALEAGIPPGVLNVVHGFGEAAGAALVAHPTVNVIALIGETSTGSAVMKNGADTLKRFHFELGGKSPILVFDDADFDRAVDAAVFGVFSLNGERCTASSRLIVQRGVHDAFVEAVVERAKTIRVGDPLDPETEVGPLIHPRHCERVLEYVRTGQAEGATLLTGGESGLGGNYLRPAVFAGVHGGMRIAQEEVFGPFLVVIPFDSEVEAVAVANGVEYGLAAYLWTRDLKRAHRVAHALEAGMVWVNSQNVRHLPTPFGGMKQSGMGRDGGTYSFEFFTELKNIAIALGEHHIPVLGKKG